ncbi:MAG: calcium/sodium antiporter, partial [Luteolibacter sp.]
NIFNIVLVLGLSSVVAPEGIAVSQEAIDFDMLVMLAVALVTVPVFLYGYGVGRIGGVFFLGFYGAYLAYLILEAVGSAVFPGYRDVMVQYVAPAVGLVLLGVLVAAMRQRKNPA